MPRPRGFRPDPNGVTDLGEQKRRVAAGTGYFVPVPPHPSVTAAYLALYLAERTAWDEVPEVGVLRSAYIDQTTGYALPIPQATWGVVEGPRQLLVRIAGLLMDGRTDHALLRRIDPQELINMTGVYLRWEGYSRRSTLADIPTLEQAGFTDVRHLVNDEDNGERREVRVMTAAMVDGTVVCCKQFRDEPENISTVINSIKRDTSSSWRGGNGNIASALMRLAVGLLSTLRPTLPEPTDGAMPL